MLSVRKIALFLSKKSWFLFFLKKYKDRKSGVDNNSPARNNGGQSFLDFLFAVQNHSSVTVYVLAALNFCF